MKLSPTTKVILVFNLVMLVLLALSLLDLGLGRALYEDGSFALTINGCLPWFDCASNVITVIYP